MREWVTVPTASQSRPGDGAPESRYYRRQVFRGRTSKARVQILVVPGKRPSMEVKVHEETMDLDFRTHVVRSDLEGTYLKRPGYHLPTILAEYRAQRRPVILLNGNNVGYWGNQFVIENGVLQYKRRGPLFDNGMLRADATGDHAFFIGRGGFRIANLNVTAHPPKDDDTGVDLGIADGAMPRYGLSGFPLIRNACSVWAEHAPLAWDPGLLYDLGPVPAAGYDYAWVRNTITELLAADEPLAQHPMTVLGVDNNRDIVLLVAERSEASPGITVADAADLLLRRYDVTDAIVLGAAGDAQLATTEEGFLIEPFIAPYAEDCAEPIPWKLVHPDLRHKRLRARPVPSYVVFHLDRPAAQHEKAEPFRYGARTPAGQVRRKVVTAPGATSVSAAWPPSSASARF